MESSEVGVAPDLSSRTGCGETLADEGRHRDGPRAIGTGLGASSHGLRR
jgi:hypothetical protein